MWSSWGEGGYSMGVSTAKSSIFGEWVHSQNPIVKDGGHGMVFSDSLGNRFLTYHSPNEKGKEHPVFIPFK